MSEARMKADNDIVKLPIPLSNYVYLIKYRKSPYYDIVNHIVKEMEIRYVRNGRGVEVVYTINPRVLQEEIEKRAQSEKVTVTNVCRTVLAFLHGCGLRKDEDFYVSTTSGGRRNYHVRVNARTLNLMNRFMW